MLYALAWKHDDRRSFVYENYTVERRDVLQPDRSDIRFCGVRGFGRVGEGRGD